MKIDKSSIAHTTWNCKYHIVFAPKYRWQVRQMSIKELVGPFTGEPVKASKK